jgi:hypothetical protein
MPPRGASARLGLIWGVLFFVCLQAALAGALERSPSLRDPEYAAKLAGLRRRLAEQPDAALVLVLGSSRVLVDLRPEGLPPYRTRDGREALVYNAGLIEAGPLTEWMCLRRLLAAGVRPAFVLVEYYPSTELAEDDRIPPQRLAWDDVRLLAPYCPDPGHLYWDWGEHRLLPWFTDRRALLRTCAPDWLPPANRVDARLYPIDRGGWKPCPNPTVIPEARRRLIALQHDHHARIFQWFHPSRTAENALRDLLGLCRQQRIGTALLFLPEAGGFRTCYPPALLAELDAWLRGLGREYGAPLIDARTWSADDDFADGCHLLPDGAAAFTARLGREALGPLLEGRPLRLAGPGPRP